MSIYLMLFDIKKIIVYPHNIVMISIDEIILYFKFKFWNLKNDHFMILC